MLDYLEIPLTGEAGAGRFVKVSPADYNQLVRYKWYYRDGYCLSQINGKEVRMHRFVMNENDPMYVIDHINRDRLDNRRNNLRRFSKKENANNKENNRWIEAWGEKKTVSEWVDDERCEVGYEVLLGRLRREVLPEYAILAPEGAERKFENDR